MFKKGFHNFDIDEAEMAGLDFEPSEDVAVRKIFHGHYSPIV
jgi:hypothetical protein